MTLLTGAILELGDGHVGSGDVSRGFPEKVIDGGTQAGGARGRCGRREGGRGAGKVRAGQERGRVLSGS